MAHAPFPMLDLSIDVGGTFTDCIGTDAQGTLRRIKVLSHGAIRGQGEVLPGSAAIAFRAAWSFPEGWLTGFRFRWLSTGRETTVTGHFHQNHLHLEEEGPETGDFELFTGEEAPILAARILTLTPPGQPLPPIHLKLGTTRGTNALLERKGAKVAFVTNAGFGDLPVIGDQQRPDLFALNIQKPTPLHTTSLEAAVRMSADGTVLQDWEEEEITRIISGLRESGAEAVAIALMHSYRNPAHELRLTEACHQAGFRFVSGSAGLSPTIKLLPRARAAITDAYLSPVMNTYLSRIAAALPGGKLEVMTSTGSLAPAHLFRAKDSLLSGPAGGLTGAASVAQQAGLTHILTLDMGGTSADVARWDGQWAFQYETRVGDAVIASPSVAIHTVAAGGGSVCGFDGLRLFVGPESAGASPGPACYGNGGPLTLTDVNLLLGRLSPSFFPIPVNLPAAENRLDALVETSGIPARQLLQGWLDIANEAMAQAIRKISTREGFDPAGYALLAFGGAGAVHACEVAASLGITEVVVPFEAGLLSAAGIRAARPQHLEKRQALFPLAESGQLADLLQATAAGAAFRLQTDTGATPEELRQTVFLRLAGQDATLELPALPTETLSQRFEHLYRQRFGHWMQGKNIEVESVQVVALPAGVSPAHAEGEFPDISPAPTSHTVFGPVYDWQTLPPGAGFEGPAVLAGPFSTTVIAGGWTARIGSEGLVRLKKNTLHGMAPAETAAATELALFIHRFRHISEEMGALLERTSFSVNVKERLDFSCALLDPEGRLVANAPHIPVHLGSLGLCVRKVKEMLPLGPGDIALTNHPAFGGSHLPDLTLIMGVFDENQCLLGYVANRAHHAELGGKRPGSMPTDAKSLAEEGIVIPPMYLVKGGEGQWTRVKDLFTKGAFPTRAWEENEADLLAGMAALTAGADALKQLCHQSGSQKVLQMMDQLRQYTRERARAALTKRITLPARGATTLDDGSPLAVQVFMENNQFVVDFSGCGPVHPGNLNANTAIVQSVVMYVLRLCIEEDIPMNEGLLEAVTIRLPEGTLLHPVFDPDPARCPAVVGGNVEVSQQLADLLIGAMGLLAAGQGTMNNFVFGNAQFGCYETLGGGAGAGPGFIGASGVHVHMTNTRITDPEIMEHRYPVRVEAFCIRKDSGGNGAFPGGNGLIRQIRFLAPVEVSLLTQRRRSGAPGGAGGGDGEPGRQWLLRKNGEIQQLDAHTGFLAAEGEAVRIETPGGGGWGKAEE